MNRKGRVIIATFIGIIILYALGFRCVAALQTISSGVPYFYKYGPFSGRVVDMDTGKPIEGALVYFHVWTSGPSLEGLNFGGSDGVKKYTFTDENGNYYIRSKRVRRYGSLKEARRTNYDFFIYKKGYVCYNWGLIFPCNEGRMDFRWENNIAKLEPWREYYTYTDHLMFVPDFMRSDMRNPELEVAKWEIYKREKEFAAGQNMLSKDWAKLYKHVSCERKIKALEKGKK